MRKLQDLDVTGKHVLTRLDFDVPFDEDGMHIEDDNRMHMALPTIQYLIEHKAATITILAHRGQPEGPDAAMTLAPVADHLAELLHSSDAVTKTPQGFAGMLDLYHITPTISLVENIRFAGASETNNDPAFAQKIAQGSDIFVFDAFATAHRPHTSIAGVSKILPSGAGLLVQQELEHLQNLKNNPEKPFVVLIGGVKIEDKIMVIDGLSAHAEHFLIGGALANTFMKAKGEDVGDSLVQNDRLDVAKDLLQRMGDTLTLPVDSVKNGTAIMDIGPQTVMEFEDRLADAKTVFWNGNLGKTEEKQFSKGTLMIADLLARSPHVTRVVAGGDTVGFLREHDLADKMTYASTGGGATSDYLAGKELPGLEALE